VLSKAQIKKIEDIDHKIKKLGSDLQKQKILFIPNTAHLLRLGNYYYYRGEISKAKSIYKKILKRRRNRANCKISWS